MQSGLPNLMAARSVSRGLAALTADAVGRQQTEEALGYLLTNLAWSKKMLPGGLINLMVSVAQQKVALDGVEAWLYEAHPNTEQLHRLLEGLRAAEFDRLDLLVQMKRELYLADVAFTQLLESGRGGFEHLTEYQGWRLMVRLMPRSYWRSEHKALINLLLSNQSAFGELGKPGLDDPTDLLPYSFAARQLVPVNSRAQAQFMLSLTRFKALQADVALELYRREHGSYPDSLDQLVPAYLPELPVNVGSPKLWGRKPPLDYRRLGNSFRLEASSPVFETIRFKARQQFGPDGLYHLEESAR